MNWLKRLFGYNQGIDREVLHRTLLEYVQAPRVSDCRRILEAHPELLSKESSQILNRLAETKSLMSAENARRFDERRALLEQCHRRGVEVAFAELERSASPTASRPPVASSYVAPEVKKPAPRPKVQPDEAPERAPARTQEAADPARELAEMLAQVRRENPQAAQELDRAMAVLMGGNASGSRSSCEPQDVTCPHCKHRYQTDMWVIVDAQEHPELAAQCHEGTIHDVKCPKCGKTSMPDVPLMYHDSEAQQLILATQKSTTSAEDREVNKRLFGHLFPRIPGSWGLDYLDTTRKVLGVQGLQMLLQGNDPQQMLRELLGGLVEGADTAGSGADRLAELAQVLSSSRPDEEMMETVWEFLEAETWTASRRVVDEHPELLTDRADKTLAQMIVVGRMIDTDSTRVLDEHRALLQRCREVGVNAAFTEKMGLPPTLAGLLDLSGDTDDPEAMARAVARALTEQEDSADMLMHLLEQAAGSQPEASPLLDKLRRTKALHAALIVGSPADFARILQEHPELREPETLGVLDEMIATAQQQGHSDIAEHMTRLRDLLTSSQLDAFASVAASLPANLDDGRSQSLIKRGNFLEQQGQWDEAAECYVQALTAYEQANDIQGQVLALGNLGNVFQRRGQYDMALTLYQRAAQSAESLRDAETAADIYASMAGVYEHRGEYDKANDLFAKALPTIEKNGDKRKLASLYNNMAVLHERRKDYTKAESLYNQALSIYYQFDDEEEMAGVYHNLGTLYARQNQDRKAMEMFEKCLTIQQQTGREAEMAGTYGNIAVIYERREDFPKALEMYEKSLEIARRMGADSNIAAIYGNMGGLYAKRDDHNQAITYFQRSIEIAERIGKKDIVANGYFNLGQAYRKRQDKDQAIRCFKRAKEIFAQLGDKEGEAMVSLLLLTMGIHAGG